MEERDSPFAVEARKNNNRFSGGKIDDCTVVVAWVSDKAEAPRLDGSAADPGVAKARADTMIRAKL
jgi:hypothetical protein